jgi:transposase InsO family protein
MPDGGLVEATRQVLADSPFHGEGYRKVWARLRHTGLRASKERVRRLMRENGLQAAIRTAVRAARATMTARSSQRRSTPCGEPI